MSQKLEKIAELYNVADDFDAILVGYDFEVAKEYFFGRQFLELGSATGESTLKLLQFAESIDVIEGSEKNIETTKQKLGDQIKVSVRYFHSLWEDYEYLHQTYSDIIWFHGIEHIKNPQLLVQKIKKSLKPGGRIHVVTPNAFSLHRQAGVAMGMLQDVYELNERDRMVGHCVVFDRDHLKSFFENNGFCIYAEEGIMIKPLPNAKMKELSKENPDLIHAYFLLGKVHKNISAEMYFCVTLND